MPPSAFRHPSRACAQLAAFLIQSGSSSYLQSIDAASTTGARLCVYDALLGEIQLKHPRVSLYPIPSSIGHAELVAFFEQKSCSGFIWSLHEVQRSVGVARAFCALGLFATQHVIDVPIAWPASKELVGPLSYWINIVNSERDFSTFDKLDYTRCIDVYLEEVGNEGPGDSSARRRLQRSSGKGGSVAGAATIASNAGGDTAAFLIWTELGNVQSTGDKLGVGNMASAILVWLFFFFISIGRSLYEHRAAALKGTLEIIKYAEEAVTEATVAATHTVQYSLASVQDAVTHAAQNVATLATLDMPDSSSPVSPPVVSTSKPNSSQSVMSTSTGRSWC